MKTLKHFNTILLILLFTCNTFANNLLVVNSTFFYIQDLYNVQQALEDIESGSLNDTSILVVTNATDIVNGNIYNIDSLISNPGSDGISIREAVYAANGTIGAKSIIFHSSLKGDTIPFTVPDGEFLYMTSDNLTINGDIDNDGDPDITLGGWVDGEGNPNGPAIGISSSNNVINGLNFYGFGGTIWIMSPDSACGDNPFIDREIANNIISNNSISCEIGITICPQCMGSPLVSDILWQDILINGNTINTTKGEGIYIGLAGYGEEPNKMVDIAITENYFHITGDGNKAIDIIVSDVASDYFGIPGPVKFSDSNSIDTLIISNNVIDGSNGWGFKIGISGDGNCNNKLQNLTISDNIINDIKMVGIELDAGQSGHPERATEGNIVTNVSITNNTISQSWEGIAIFGSTGAIYSETQQGATMNGFDNVLIANNYISDYEEVGLFIVGGGYNCGDIYLDSITIQNNNINKDVNQYSGTGIEIIGGYGLNAVDNTLRGISLLSNQISNSGTGIEIIGGIGFGANDNEVYISRLNGNDLENNIDTIKIRNDVDGAVGNQVHINTDVSTGHNYFVEQSKLFKLRQNHPNPFNEYCIIEFEIPSVTEVEINILNLLGEEVNTLLNEEKQPGAYAVQWDGTDNRGSQVSNGIYIYQMRTNDSILCKQLILMK